jgi:hypothetical protein
MTLPYLLPALFLFWGCGYFADDYTPKPKGEMRVEIEKIKPLEIEPIIIDSIKPNIVEALIQVESSGRDNAYNAKEDAVGCLQIRPVMVREVNRILRKQGDTLRYSLKDRWSREKSLEMFHVWREYHHPNSTDEVTARCWNGGPRGYKKHSTIRYWEKVQASY